MAAAEHEKRLSDNEAGAMGAAWVGAAWENLLAEAREEMLQVTMESLAWDPQQAILFPWFTLVDVSLLMLRPTKTRSRNPHPPFLTLLFCKITQGGNRGVRQCILRGVEIRKESYS
jgi:hypothetical protein